MENKKMTKYMVFYKEEFIPLREALKYEGNINMDLVIHYMKIKNITNIQDAFEKYLKFRKEKKERLKFVDQLVQESGLDKITIRQRLNLGLSLDEVVYNGNLKRKKNANLMNNCDIKQMVFYKEKKYPFKTAIKIATDGRCNSAYSSIKNCKIYQGLTYQECFDLFIYRYQRKWEKYKN